MGQEEGQWKTAVSTLALPLLPSGASLGLSLFPQGSNFDKIWKKLTSSRFLLLSEEYVKVIKKACFLN